MENIPEPTFNGLTAKEWTSLSRNVWDDVSSPRESHHLRHGATFPFALAERVIKLYTKEGDIVLDPFVGIGTTVLAAARADRLGVGIELQEPFCDLARSLLDKEKSDLFGSKKALRHEIICDDCRALDKHVYIDSVQLTFTAPPYPDLDPPKDPRRPGRPPKVDPHEQMAERVPSHSLRQDDFGNFGYVMYMEELKRVMKKVLGVTREGGYSVWVVKDHRVTHHNKDAQYIMMHADVISLATSVGWHHHDILFWDQNDQRRLMLLGYPNVFYANPNCSYLLVFRKPRTKS